MSGLFAQKERKRVETRTEQNHIDSTTVSAFRIVDWVAGCGRVSILFSGHYFGESSEQALHELGVVLVVDFLVLWFGLSCFEDFDH